MPPKKVKQENSCLKNKKKEGINNISNTKVARIDKLKED